MTPEQRAVWLKGITTHGAYVGGEETSEHAIWRGILQRCYNPRSKDYHRYGARGITVCLRWAVYQNFLEDMGPRPSRGHQVDRVDNDAGYGPENCRWATLSEQQSNTRRNRRWEKDGKIFTLTEWAGFLGISKELAHWRMKQWGTFEKGGTWTLQKKT
jgi:hypothetical protein